MENQELTVSPLKPITRSLIGKLASVMAEISRVKKNGTNTFQRYNYATEADLVEEVRQKLGSRGVFIFTEIEEVTERDTGRKTQSGVSLKITRVKARHTFRDADSDESVTMVSYGEGEDGSDKGIYKALTGAVKYFISKNFLMSTGDDPENDAEETKPDKPAKARTAAQEKGPFSHGIPKEQHDREIAEREAAPKAGEAVKSQIDLGSFEDRIKNAKEAGRGKTGTGAPWVLYAIETEGHGVLNTFSATIFEDAADACRLNYQVTVHSEPTPKGPKIVGIEYMGSSQQPHNLKSQVA